MAVLTELELLPPSSSSSSSAHDHNRTYDYDVFLSFRGVDTRNGFTDHLYNALLDAGINTFLDEEEIETGESLKPELESAIKSSKAFIIVLSSNYASSTWCLNELVLILEQKKICKQIVIPIFYHVEPTHVRKQQNSFGEAMEKHRQKMDAETNAEKRSQFAQKMDSWERALTEVADLKGKDVKGRKETGFIQEIVADIHRRLRVPLSGNTLQSLIGMNDEIRIISSWLTDGSCHTADILTIVGMSGIGKTTLARHVFGLHSSKFHKGSFIEGIDTRCNKGFNGLLDVQKQLLRDISKKIELRVNDVKEYTIKIQNVLSGKRVFIVLDDIGDLNQLDALLGNRGLHKGSKVIITSKQNPQEGYKEVLEKLVQYCEGHPLALQVLGRSLHKRDVAYWEECLKVLKKESNHQINTALRVSFDALQYKNDKELFKHIACFFVGTNRDVTETILNSCDLNARYGIINLIDRCLLSIGWNNKLAMHSLIQEMGRDLVRQESPNLWERSRLWCHEDSFEVLKQKKDTRNLLGLTLDMRMLEKENLSRPLKLQTAALSKMDHLQLLQLNYVNINGSYQNVSKELRWLCMHGFPFKSIPSELSLEKLVVLDMSHSNIESFDMSYSFSRQFRSKLKCLIGSSSNDVRLLGSLKILDLSFCEQLQSLGGFFLLPALERLILRNCTALIEVCESVGQCDQLVYIDMSYCYKLKKIPKSFSELKKVRAVLLDGCNSFEPQVAMGNVKAIPRDLKCFMIYLPSSLRRLSLANNNLSNECFPLDLSSLAMLEELCLDGNPIVSMPDCVRTLPRLERLDLSDCHEMISIEYPPCTIRELAIYGDYYGPTSTSRKIKFHAEMSPLQLKGVHRLFWLSEIDGMVKVQGMESVEEKVLHSLGWKNLDFIKERSLKLLSIEKKIECPTQMHYEFGIFSTFYEGKELPDWISCRSKGSSISFTIPSSPNNLRGLNFCSVESSPWNNFSLPLIEISNITQNHTWIYRHHFDGEVSSEVYSENFSEDGEENFEDGEENYEDCEENFEDGEEHFVDGEEHLIDVKEFDGRYYLSYLSHWMFGPNEMKVGDHITITVAEETWNRGEMECGIGLVYDEDEKNEEEEDVLGYYKSWNHIIGGDLSPFQLTTGEFILDNWLFRRYDREATFAYLPFIDLRNKLKEEKMSFRAFSQQKSGDFNTPTRF